MRAASRVGGGARQCLQHGDRRREPVLLHDGVDIGGHPVGLTESGRDRDPADDRPPAQIRRAHLHNGPYETVHRRAGQQD